MRMKLIASVLVALVLAYAWIDGGEEPLRSIAEPVDLPETTR
jgi:hypothetical protein